MALQYSSHVIVFNMFYNIHTMTHICGLITFQKIFFKLKNIFGTNKFMVNHYEKNEFKRS